MYTANSDLHQYIIERLTDAQVAFRGEELQRLRAAVGDQRQERRFPVFEPASLYSTDPLQREQIQVQVMDVSQKGLGIASWMQLRRGSNVRVHLKDTLVMGEIRYCRPCGNAFQAGILIESVLRRSGGSLSLSW